MREKLTKMGIDEPHFKKLERENPNRYNVMLTTKYLYESDVWFELKEAKERIDLKEREEWKDFNKFYYPDDQDNFTTIFS